MRNLDDRLRHDLTDIAGQATPSPTTAWEAIQSRIAEQADHPETEIIMLQTDPRNDHRLDGRVLAAAAAVLVLLIGVTIALFSNGDSNSLDVTDTETTVPVTTSTPAPPTTEAVDPVTTVVGNEAAELDAAAASDALAIAEQFIDARNAYDGAAVRELLSDSATMRDDLQRNPDGVFRSVDEVDFARTSDFDGVVGTVLADPNCSVGAEVGRVICTYTWQNAWSRAIGDDRYTGNTFVFDIADGQIVGLTHTFRQGPVDGFENHISEVMFLWVVTNHPDDRSTVLDSNGLPIASDPSISLWREFTEEFVAEDALAIAEAFMAARSAYDGEAVRALVADDATISLAYEWIDSPDQYRLLTDYERAHGMRFLDPRCEDGSLGRVRCTYTLESDLTVALGVGPYEASFVLDIGDGVIQQVNHTRTGNTGSPGSYYTDVHFIGFGRWVAQDYAEEYLLMSSPNATTNVHPPLITAESVALWEQLLPEFIADVSVSGDGR